MDTDTTFWSEADIPIQQFLYDWLIDFNSISICLGLFYA